MRSPDLFANHPLDSTISDVRVVHPALQQPDFVHPESGMTGEQPSGARSSQVFLRDRGDLETAAAPRNNKQWIPRRGQLLNDRLPMPDDQDPSASLDDR